jgi:hypothetical protein
MPMIFRWLEVEVLQCPLGAPVVYSVPQVRRTFREMCPQVVRLVGYCRGTHLVMCQVRAHDVYHHVVIDLGVPNRRLRIEMLT